MTFPACLKIKSHKIVSLRRERLNYITFDEDDSHMTSYKGKRKREEGKKISSKELGEKGIVFLKSDTKVM